MVEASPVAGGGLRSDELTLPGYRHDASSAIHPLAVASPFLSTLPLQEHGLEWIEPPLPCAHPPDGRPAALLARDPGVTASRLGADGSAWLALVKPFLARWPGLLPELLGPLHLPRHPWAMARFGSLGLRPATAVAGRFRDENARALWGGLAAHSLLPPPGAIAHCGHRAGAGRACVRVAHRARRVGASRPRARRPPDQPGWGDPDRLAGEPPGGATSRACCAPRPDAASGNRNRG